MCSLLSIWHYGSTKVLLTEQSCKWDVLWLPVCIIYTGNKCIFTFHILKRFKCVASWSDLIWLTVEEYITILQFKKVFKVMKQAKIIIIITASAATLELSLVLKNHTHCLNNSPEAAIRVGTFPQLWRHHETPWCDTQAPGLLLCNTFWFWPSR